MSSCDDDELVAHFFKGLYTFQRARHWLWSHDTCSVIDLDLVMGLNWSSPVGVLTHISHQCMFADALYRDHLLSNNDNLCTPSQIKIVYHIG